MIEYQHLMMALMGIIALASLVTTIILSRGKAASDRVAAVEREIDGLTTRVTSLESDMRHKPGSEQMHAMELALREMAGQLGVMQERLKPIASTTERLQEFLIDEAQQRRGVA